MGSIYKEPRYNVKHNRGGVGGGKLIRGVGWVRGNQYRWCAEIRINGVRYRKRSSSYDDCRFWLDAMETRKGGK